MSEDHGLPQFDGLLGMLDGWDSAVDGLPLTLDYQPAPVPELEWVAPPPESADWSWEQWQRFASVGMVRAHQHAMDVAFLGTAAVPMSWPEAEAFYDRVQAEADRVARVEREELARLYWSGPDRIARRMLRECGATAAELGLVQRSAFSSEYRRRQRARVKRRRR